MKSICPCCQDDMRVDLQSGKRYEECSCCGLQLENGVLKKAPTKCTESQAKALGIHDKDAKYEREPEPKKA
jgi:Zn-finger nucleic acid-binding protein